MNITVLTKLINHQNNKASTRKRCGASFKEGFYIIKEHDSTTGSLLRSKLSLDSWTIA